MRLNAEAVVVAGDEDNMKIVSVTGDPVRYGVVTAEGEFLEDGVVKDGESVVVAQARTFVSTYQSTVNIQDVTDEDTKPDITAPDRRSKLSKRLDEVTQAAHPEDDVQDVPEDTDVPERDVPKVSAAAPNKDKDLGDVDTDDTPTDKKKRSERKPEEKKPVQGPHRPSLKKQQK